MAKMVLGHLFGRSVLIVAQDAKTRESLAGAFQSFRCNVLLAADEANAISLLETNPQIEIIIVEVNSPIARGFPLLDKIRSLDVERPPIFFVSDKKDEDFDEAFFHGVEAVFLKPIHFDEVVKGVAFSYGMLMDNANRQHRRRRLRRARAQFSVESGEAPSTGYVTNISLGGMFISSMALLPSSNQVVTFKVQYEDEKVYEVTGRAVVRWLRPMSEYGRPPGFGVEFMNLDAESTETIRILATQPT